MQNHSLQDDLNSTAASNDILDAAAVQAWGDIGSPENLPDVYTAKSEQEEEESQVDDLSFTDLSTGVGDAEVFFFFFFW